MVYYRKIEGNMKSFMILNAGSNKYGLKIETHEDRIDLYRVVIDGEIMIGSINEDGFTPTMEATIL